MRDYKKKAEEAPKRDYQAEQGKIIVDRLLENFAQGYVWRPGWQKGGVVNSPEMPFSLVRGTNYNGGNALACWAVATVEGYSSNGWLTFKDAKNLGGSVKAGEHGLVLSRPIWKDKLVEVKDKEGRPIIENGEVKKRKVEYYAGTKWFTVFNYDQCKDLPPLEDFTSVQARTFRAEKIKDKHMDITKEMCEGAFVKVRWLGDRAYYSPTADMVTMPDEARFESGELAFATATHELSHASGAEHRLNRNLASKFDMDSYAFEELVAELSSVFVCAQAGVSKTNEQLNAAYLESWSKHFKENPNDLMEKVLPLALKASAYVIKECGLEAILDKHIGEQPQFTQTVTPEVDTPDM